MNYNEYNEHISEVEFVTAYPKPNSQEKIFLAIVRLEKGKRALIYAPSIARCEMSISVEEDIHDCRFGGRRLCEISNSRYVMIGNEMHTLPNSRTHFTVVVLDEVTAPHVKKGDIEKLFGCIVDG